jgi:argininosuccinate synthase
VLHISYEAGSLDHVETTGIDVVDFGMTVSPQQAPEEAQQVTLEFRSGVPVALDGQAVSPLEMVERLNKIAGSHGVGRIDVVENRFVGMKSRGVYESPGMTVLYDGLRYIEQLTMDRDLMHLRDRLSPEVAEMVYYGFWFCPKMDALMAFIRQAQQPTSGQVTLRLYKGNVQLVKRSSPLSLYDPSISTMEGGGSYNQTDAEGFLRLMSLPGRVQGLVRPRSY